MAVLIAGLAVSVVEVLSRPFAGAILAYTVVLPLAAVSMGLSRASANRVGWRGLLAAADVAIVIGAGGSIIRPGIDRFLSLPLFAVVLLVLLAAVAMGSLLTARGLPAAASEVRRSTKQRLLLVALIATWAGYFLTFYGSLDLSGFRGLLDLVGFVGAPVAVILLLVVTWWLGSSWLLAAYALSGLAAAAATGLTGPSGAFFGAFCVLGLGAAAVGPRESRPENPPQGSSRRSSAATIWLGIGALLYAPTVLWGMFPIGVIVDCFEACAQPIAGAGILVALTVLSVLVVASAAFVSVAGGSAASAARPFYTLSFASAVLVIVEIGMGLADIAPFGFLPAAAPAATLVAIGSAAGWLRPAWLAGTSRGAAWSAAAVVFIWVAASVGGFGAGWAAIVAVPAAALIAIGMAVESARSAGPVEEAPVRDASVDAQFA